VLDKEGRGFYEDLAVHSQLAILLAQSRQFLLVRRRQARLALRELRSSALDPLPERRPGQAQVARPSSSTIRTASALYSSVNWRRTRR